jgi:hypothetical protein
MCAWENDSICIIYRFYTKDYIRRALSRHTHGCTGIAIESYYPLELESHENNTYEPRSLSVGDLISVGCQGWVETPQKIFESGSIQYEVSDCLSVRIFIYCDEDFIISHSRNKPC